MPRLPTWRELQKVCELAGYTPSRTKGDHLIMSKPGSPRPVVIKMDPKLSDDIVHSNRRTMGLTTDEFNDLLNQVRKKKK